MTWMEGGISINNVHVGGMPISQNHHETLCPISCVSWNCGGYSMHDNILIGSKIFFN